MKTKINIRKYFRTILIVLITIIFCLTLLEIGLRISGHRPSNMTDGFFEKYGNSYRLKKNIKKITNWPSYSYITYTNSFGFRDKKIGERNPNNKPYIIFLGGSDAFGNGVNYEDSFVGIFAEAASKRNIEILNMAVGGHYFEDQKALFIEFMDNVSRKPSKVVLCVNPTIIYEFDWKRDDTLVKNGYLFSSKNWKIAYIKRIIGSSSSVYCFFRDNIRKMQTKYSDHDSILNKSFIKYFKKNGHMFNPEKVKECEATLDIFDKYCRENNLTLIFLYLPLIDGFGLNELLIKLGKNPGDYDASYYEEMVKSYCEKRKLKLINATPVLKSLYEKGIQVRFKLDSHYNQYANRVVGTYLIEEMFE